MSDTAGLSDLNSLESTVQPVYEDSIKMAVVAG